MIQSRIHAVRQLADQLVRQHTQKEFRALTRKLGILLEEERESYQNLTNVEKQDTWGLGACAELLKLESLHNRLSKCPESELPDVDSVVQTLRSFY